MTTVDELVARVQAQMSLDSETEHEILAEIREHLAARWCLIGERRRRGKDESDDGG